MGQSPSTPKPTRLPDPDDASDDLITGEDYTVILPEECLALIFHSFSTIDRKRASLVCRRWLRVEGQTRHRLSLNGQSELCHVIAPIFNRFDSLTKLALKCDRTSVSISDKDLILISLSCRNLSNMSLRGCREVTDDGVSAFAANCVNLRIFSCGSCSFGAKGMNALLDNCEGLEGLSVKRLRGMSDEPIGVGKAGNSLRVVCLKDLDNGQCFGEMITGAKNLRCLKLFRCSGDWNKLLETMSISGTVDGISEVHLEGIRVGDVGLLAVANCRNLEILHLVKTPACTNLGLMAVAEKCGLLRKLHIDGWKTNRISDEGLIAVANHCSNLQELVLIGVNPTHLSLDKLASNCLNLEKLELCGSKTVGDVEISCIAANCVALKRLCIKSCPVSDHGMEALAGGCPNLVKVKVKKCKEVTSEGADLLRASRGSLTVELDGLTLRSVERWHERELIG